MDPISNLCKYTCCLTTFLILGLQEHILIQVTRITVFADTRSTDLVDFWKSKIHNAVKHDVYLDKLLTGSIYATRFQVLRQYLGKGAARTNEEAKSLKDKILLHKQVIRWKVMRRSRFI